MPAEKRRKIMVGLVRFELNGEKVLAHIQQKLDVVSERKRDYAQRIADEVAYGGTANTDDCWQYARYCDIADELKALIFDFGNDSSFHA